MTYQTMSLEQYETEELAFFYSDYHKDLMGFRPLIDLTDRDEVIQGIKALDRHMDWMKSTPEGLARLREDGWDV